MNVRQSLILDLAVAARDAANAAADNDTPQNDHELEVAVRDLFAAVDHEYPPGSGRPSARGSKIKTGAGEDAHGGRAQAPSPVATRPSPVPSSDPAAALSIAAGILDALRTDGGWCTTPELVDTLTRGGRVRAKLNSMTVGTALAEAMRRAQVDRRPLEVARNGARFEWRAL